MAINDEIIVAPIGGVHPRAGGTGGARGVHALAHFQGHGGGGQQMDDSADISLSHGRQAAALLYSATMDQIAQLAGLDVDPAQLQAGAIPDGSHSRHLLLGIVALFEHYRGSHPQLAAQDAQKIFIPMAQAGLERGYQETCQVLRQLNACPPATAGHLQALCQLTGQLLRERFGLD
ncbi:DUF5610 domain-containing protein [Chromobacterium sphagni]|uniref:DUF5610 domain-containing protein n=1 Tax=Chromobacterium sphagni TaxID=1903179 RepID=A0A1S1X520_9NEIS|nr:DUF5610 domain-containing protein [Chromobacterium sphagni]OHX14568.1 hypothetical protein BI347_14430 [Chromobacterium sphagni]OHX20645.1 hypothetical protein BI344_14915 [Chromobacterium sphagni]